MNNSIYKFKDPVNEEVKKYYPKSKESKHLIEALENLQKGGLEIPVIIGGKEYFSGNTENITQPHNHQVSLGKYHKVTEKLVHLAIETALEAKKKWQALSWLERASITLKAAELIATKYRYVINASTMLTQSKNVYQAEIDAAAESIDFLRYNAYYATDIYSDQPKSSSNTLNRLEYRALEGFIYAVSPFNFTSIGSNLNMSPVLMGNVTIWKPASTSVLSNYFMMKVFEEAGVPDGVINFLPGSGSTISNIVLKHKDLAGIHFTGSNGTFNTIWKEVAKNIENYKSYPRIVGETGGKDFIFAHKSADLNELATAIIRGAFEYQGQKCSAASRSYIPKSKWKALKPLLIEQAESIKVGDVTEFDSFMNAVIDEKSFDNIMGYIDMAHLSENAEVIAGGTGDKSVGYFIDPTIIVTSDPDFITMREEIFGPVMTIFIYEDEKFEETLELCDNTSPYGLTGAIFAKDRYAIIKANEVLKYAAGNFYVNDKPSGAMVGQQPFGGSRASGTNDKAGGKLNLMRWVSPRTVKETFLPDTEYKYPFMTKSSCDKKVEVKKDKSCGCKSC
jgi:1-pyrroline-5-carboxylate dehydrogenase